MIETTDNQAEEKCLHALCIHCVQTTHAINNSPEGYLRTYLLPLKSRFTRSVPTASTVAKVLEKI